MRAPSTTSGNSAGLDDDLQQLGAALRAADRVLSQAAGDLSDQVRELAAGGWKAECADRFGSDWAANARKVSQLASACTKAGSVLAGLAGELPAAWRQQHAGLYPGARPAAGARSQQAAGQAPGQPLAAADPRRAALARLAAIPVPPAFGRPLQATQVDAWAARLGAMPQPLTSRADREAVGEAGAALRRQLQGKDPGLPWQVNAWWRGLGAAPRNWLTEHDAQTVGALDGLPAPVHDEADRAYMNDEYTVLERERARLRSLLGPVAYYTRNIPVIGWLTAETEGQSAARAELARVDTVLRDIATIRHELQLSGRFVLPRYRYIMGHSGAGHWTQTLIPVPAGTPGAFRYPHVYLLGFSPGGSGQAEVAYGDPDTARNVLTFVPGLNTPVSNLRASLANTITMWQQAQAYDPHGKVSAIMWLGHDRPGLSASELNPSSSALDAWNAKAGAVPLDSFVAGLAAAHDRTFRPHTVMAAHSYGGLYAGEALVRAHGHLADDLVLLGSEGIGVNKASQLGMSPSHVFAAEARNDVFPKLGPSVPVEQLEADALIAGVDPSKFGGDLWNFGRATADNLLHHSGNSHFGTDPATSRFGGRVLSVAPSTLLWGHFSYFDPRSLSVRNIAHLIDGQYNQVEYASPGPSPVPRG